MRGADLQQFLDSLAGWPPRQERYDTGALCRMAPADRTAAEEVLLERTRGGDPRAALTLSALGTSRALPELEALAATPGRMGACARRAVLELRRDDGAAAAVAADLDSGSMYERLAAVESLAGHGGSIARRALDRGLDDADPAVRWQSGNRLIELLGLASLRGGAGGLVEPMAPLERLSSLLLADLAALHRHAAAALREIAAARDEGASAEELDLAYRAGPDPRFRRMLGDTVGDTSAAIPVDAIRGAGDHDRAFAEALLALRLQPTVRDLRAPPALADLEAGWTIPALEESAVGLPAHADFAVAATSALARLRG